MSFFRYENTPQSRSQKGKRTLTTNIPPKVEKSSEDIYIYAREGDRLDLYAQRYYQDQTKWTIIAAANNLKEMVVIPGTQIRIPTFSDDVVQEWSKQNNDR